MSVMKSRTLPFLLLASCLVALPLRAQFPNFPTADRVLGATSFTVIGSTAETPAGMESPSGLAIDPFSGKLFVADLDHNRILRFPDAASLANGANAEAVFGQVNFSGITSGTTATKLDSPGGLHIDSSGRLWVADAGNNRVLMFQGAATLPGFGATPDLVLGQPNFATVTPGTSAIKMTGPTEVFVDAADNLWVADFKNNRVLKFAAVSGLANGAAATNVLGQADFDTSNTATSPSKMDSPAGVMVDAAGRLWVSDRDNNRVLRFDNAAALGDGAAATVVLGQTDFTTATSATTDRNMAGPTLTRIDPAGTLYVSENSNNRILLFKNAAAKANGDPADGVIGQPDFTTATQGVTAQKFNPSGMALDAAGRLWVSDYTGYRVLRFSPDRSASTPAVGRVPKTTGSGKLTIKGTATDTSGVAQVRYRVGKGAFKTAVGTTVWSFKAKLKPGKNTIEIVVVDSLGNTSPAKKVKVTRR
jgi:sugar lactone lactonase YvrE